jgi:S1-C subfamily serine protease
VLPQRYGSVLLLAGLGLVATACGGTPSESTARATASVIYGDDDREEPWADDVPPWLAAIVTTRLVALGPASQLAVTPSGDVRLQVPTLGQRFQLCQGEAFAEQPSFAVCSGVIFSSRYVLTAEHCTRALPLAEQVALSGFFYESPGRLSALHGSELHAISKVVAKDDFYDYAWLELAEPLELPALVVDATTEGEPISSAHHGAGLPAKLARSTATGVDEDFFLSTIDAAGGASGGPVFSESGGLLGILTSGAADYHMTPEGCWRELERVESSESAAELTVSARRALDGLCSQVPDAEPCEAPARGESTGCAVARSPPRGGAGLVWSSVAALGLAARVRRWPSRRRSRASGR